MANKNIISPTAAKIFASWQKEGRSEKPRAYLGASIIGHDCDMYLWMMFRGIVKENFDGRMYRLFDRGKREEAVFCNDLRRIGIEVREFDGNGNQWEVKDFGGHFAGHLDGLAKGFDEAPTQWFVTEFKTHSDASFKKLCKEGVMKAKPMHYAQMQVYMGKLGLKKALYMAVDKDNDDLWCEIVDYNKNAFEQIMMRAKHIIDTVDPDKCAKRPDDFRCKACPCSSLCWNHETFVHHSVPETCRTCCHATADTEHGGWICHKKHSCIPDGCCKDHLILPSLVCADIVDGDENGINYNSNGNVFRVGKDGLSLDEAKKIGPNEIKEITIIKESIPSAKVISTNRLEMICKSGEYDRYFSGSQEELLDLYKAIDMSKPISVEEHDNKKYFEFPDNLIVVFDFITSKLSLYGEKMPF